MIPSFRWFGPTDPVPLQHIRQIPGVQGVVGALFEIPVGEAWPLAAIQQLQQQVESAGLRLNVIESIPVHEDIKLGRPARDGYIAAYQQSIRHLGQCGVGVLCYNFMPVFDWVRTDLAMPLPDGSTALAYDEADLHKLDFSDGLPDMPAWANRYNREEFQAVMRAYQSIDDEMLFQNLVYFLNAVIPVAEAANVKLAIHPDDPPWSVFGLPRIVRDSVTIQRLLDAVPSPYNGLTFCTGSLGAQPNNPLIDMLHQFHSRIHFVHLRNLLHTGARTFHESEHPSAFGHVDMFGVVQALIEHGFDGPFRPDHGRMIWGETGKAGYGLYDRALGIMYLQGLIEAISRGDYGTTQQA
ncbi:MAG: mannonate dehydratase [Phototrophicaceae bacterium]|jgi:mannonate dehydratase